MNDMIDPTAPRVAPLSKFRNKLDDGSMVASHPAIPVRKLDEKHYYICTVKNASMHNFDGKKIPFVGGFLGTDLKGDVDYLEGEIALGNGYVRHATEEEILTHNLQTNPHETIREEVKKQLLDDPTVRAELEAKIRAELMGQQAGLGQGDGSKLAGVDAPKKVPDAVDNKTGAEIKLTPISTANISAAAKKN